MEQKTFLKILSINWAHTEGNYAAGSICAALNEVEAILEISQHTISGRCRKGIMPPATKIWRAIYWHRQDIQKLSELIASNKKVT